MASILIMTHPAYTTEALNTKSLSELKAIYTQIGCTRACGDKRKKAAWAVAILRFQEQQIVQVEGTCATCPKFDSDRGVILQEKL
ncbi:hypothetical protein [Mastigocladopsis repens]|uniref:hypothetical protein n=1 Tax=Mastigocladopsis repens TaxID=221287 RepID=UPI00036AF3ED|nr:hypothetical protein [Mastigocladopsis repens]